MSNSFEAMPEWAPLESAEAVEAAKTKRRKFLLFVQFPIVAVSVLVLLADFLGMLNVEGWSHSIVCLDGKSVNGFRLLMYGGVLLPLVIVTGILAFRAKRQIAILKSRQNPLPGEKVVTPTEIKKGLAVCFWPAITLLLTCLIFPLMMIMTLSNTEGLVVTMTEADVVAICSAPASK